MLEVASDDAINISVNWSKLSAADKETYTSDIDVHLNAVKIPVGAISCKDTECRNEQHFEALNVLYEGLVGVLTEASKKLSNKRRKHSNQPGWNDHVADLHKDARECFVMWCNNGKPRQGWIFDLMHQTRYQFKYALRMVKNNENVLRRESLANKLSCSNPNKFWQEIRTMTSKNTSLPSSIEGVTGKHAISELWKSHFGRLLNVIQDAGLCDISCDTEYSDYIHVSTNEVVLAVQALGANKASGLDGIVAEHLLYSSERWCTMLAMCLSGLFVHVFFLPDSMLAVVLVPIIKDKTGRIDRIDNYRPIALASVVSKVVERILLDRISHFLETWPNQFGFKPSLGTDTCIYVLKEMVDKYKSLNGGMYMCFLDASKAFDRVKHSVLFNKLTRRGVPGYIVKLLSYWYAKQTMRVRWGDCISSPFRVSNGVRQGGILSPYLFNVYMDDLSSLLNCCNTGCVSGDTIINHMMYADDLVLISPSATGMKELLCACEVYSLEHAIVYNSKKSTVLVCRNKATRHAVRPSFIVNGDVIPETDKVKYLGHIICSDLSDDEDMMRQRRYLYAQGNVLSRSFHMCSINVKNTLFRTFCTPMHTCHLWWNYTAQSFHKLKVAFNNAFRMMHNLPRYCSASEMFTVNRVADCKAVIRNLVHRFMMRLAISNHLLVRSILSSDLVCSSRIRRHWARLLYVHYHGG